MGERLLLFVFHPPSPTSAKQTAEAVAQLDQDLMLTQYSPSVCKPVEQQRGSGGRRKMDERRRRRCRPSSDGRRERVSPSSFFVENGKKEGERERGKAVAVHKEARRAIIDQRPRSASG